MFSGVQAGIDHCHLYLRGESQPIMVCEDEPILIPDASSTPGIPNGLRSYLLAPILHRGKKVAVLELGSRMPNAFSELQLTEVQATAQVLGLLLTQGEVGRPAAEQRIRSLEARVANAEQLSAVGRLVAGAA